MKRRRPLVEAVALLLLGGAPAHGHDFWLEPGDWRPEVGRVLAVRLRVGQHFRGEAVPRQQQHIERFVAVGPAGATADVVGRDGAEPAGLFRPVVPGLYLLGYRSLRTPIELEAGVFEAYLKEEGLERVIEERERRGERARPGRELYSRCAKAVLAVGGGAEAKGEFDRVFGFPLELVPERNPSALAAGGALAVRLLYAGRGLEGALVVGLADAAPEAAVSARTGPDGRAVLRLAHPGPWLVKAVHMVPAPPDSGADWESFWASLTFSVPRDGERGP